MSLTIAQRHAWSLARTLIADSEASRAVFRIEAARDSDLIARGIPRIVRAAFRFDGAQFEVRAA